jgi:hypothetical protein
MRGDENEMKAVLAHHLQHWFADQVIGTFYILPVRSVWRACGAQHAGRRATPPRWQVRPFLARRVRKRSREALSAWLRL